MFRLDKMQVILLVISWSVSIKNGLKDMYMLKMVFALIVDRFIIKSDIGEKGWFNVLKECWNHSKKCAIICHY
jgi:hypothetical protein